jgi:hypothetical protein
MELGEGVAGLRSKWKRDRSDERDQEGQQMKRQAVKKQLGGRAEEANQADKVVAQKGTGGGMAQKTECWRKR